MENVTVALEDQREEDQAARISAKSAFNSRAPSPDITHECTQSYYAVKRLIDIVLATSGIVVLIPMFLVIAICIKLGDGGDILYSREMIGLEGRRFFLLKFRSMIPDADAYLEKHPELMQKFQQNMKLKYDPRITRVGRFLRRTCLDELPQLFNVLVGQISLVGPRPIHESELARYGQYAQKRLSVKPGITGSWQISPDRHSCYEERIPLDMYYIDNRSIGLDLIILLKTLKIFFVHTGV